MPAVIPAEVHTSPSRTKMASGSTVIVGKRSASSSQLFQCVVARLPSSRPAAASTNAPLHTDAVRRARRAACRIASIIASSWTASRTPSPPATTRVSSAVVAMSATGAVATNRIPPDVTISPGLDAATSTTYFGCVEMRERLAMENTSPGPHTSRTCTPG